MEDYSLFDWSSYNRDQGVWYKLEIKGRTLHVIPDFGNVRYFWVVIWAGNKDKTDKKTGEFIPARPIVKATGTGSTRAEAMQDALERAHKPRPRAKGEEYIEETLAYEVSD